MMRRYTKKLRLKHRKTRRHRRSTRRIQNGG